MIIKPIHAVKQEAIPLNLNHEQRKTLDALIYLLCSFAADLRQSCTLVILLKGGGCGVLKTKSWGSFGHDTRSDH